MSTLEVGKTYDITDRFTVDRDRGQGNYELTDSQGQIVHFLLSPNSKAEVREVPIEPRVGSVSVDKEGEFFLRTPDGNWTWLGLGGHGTRGAFKWSDLTHEGREFPVVVIYEPNA